MRIVCVIHVRIGNPRKIVHLPMFCPKTNNVLAFRLTQPLYLGTNSLVASQKVILISFCRDVHARSFAAVVK
jgi:hypothetical protein